MEVQVRGWDELNFVVADPAFPPTAKINLWGQPPTAVRR